MGTSIPRTAAAPRAGERGAGPGVRQLGIFALAYLVYFGVRAVTEGNAQDAVAHALGLVRLEQDLRIDWEQPLQEAALRSRTLVDAANAVYMYGHWPIIVIAGVLLFRYRPAHYFRLRDVCLMSGLVGLVIFSVYPVAPPRLTDLPLVDTVTRDDAGYRQIFPPSMVNEYAALPSFHAGWNVLLGIVVFGATRHWLLRALAVAGPAAMVVAVVVTANHYVVDVVAGVAIVIACLLLRDRLHRRRRTRPSMESDAWHRRSDECRSGSGGAVPHSASRGERPLTTSAGAGARRAVR